MARQVSKPGTRKNKKLAIVCGAPSSEMTAPFNDPEYEVWVLGNRSQNYPRFDLIFEIHDDLSEHDERYAKWLIDKKIPMVVGENFPLRAEHTIVFPYEESKQLFGSLYLTSSPAMMVCYAMLKGYQHMELFGVDLAIDDFEYFWQRPCMEAWIGFARGRGHTVILPDVSPVCRADYVEGRECGGKPEFGLPPFTEEEFLALAQRHTDKINEANGQIEKLQAVIQSNDGARQAYLHLGRTARAVEAGIDVKNLTDTAVMR
jgi:hypothetical protein